MALVIQCCRHSLEKLYFCHDNSREIGLVLEIHWHGNGYGNVNVFNLEICYAVVAEQVPRLASANTFTDIAVRLHAVRHAAVHVT